MGFLDDLMSDLDSAKAKVEANPQVDAMIDKLKSLNIEGKLDDTLKKAEAAFDAKKTAGGGADADKDGASLQHFMDELKSTVDKLGATAEGVPAHLSELKEQMENTLSGILK